MNMIGDGFQSLVTDTLAVDGGHVAARWGVPHNASDRHKVAVILTDRLESPSQIIEGPILDTGPL